MRKSALLACAGLIALFTSCKHSNENIVNDIELTATTPLIVDTNIINKFVAQIKSIRHIEVRSLEKGYLEKIFVDEGQFVKKGQKLFQIQALVYNAEAQKYKAELSAAKLELQNTQLLADKNIVAPNELALAKAKVAKANAELSLANSHLQFTTISAPFDGIVGLLEKKLGSTIDEGELITSLSDNSEIWVYFNVPEVTYLNYKTKTNEQHKDVLLEMANQEKYAHKGVIDAIEADFNNETGNIAFRATFPNPDQLLRNGETGNILLESPIKNAIIIPQKSTFEIMDKKYVFVVDKNNVAHLTPINILGAYTDLFIIKDGLKGNETIILDGIRKVQDNMKVKINQIPIRKVISQLKVASE